MGDMNSETAMERFMRLMDKESDEREAEHQRLYSNQDATIRLQAGKIDELEYLVKAALAWPSSVKHTGWYKRAQEALEP